MLHVFIGTKAQYVKVAPVLQVLDKWGVHYNLIDSGQHGDLSRKYRQYFGIKDPDIWLTRSKKDIMSLAQFLWWFFQLLCRVFFRPRRLQKEIFKNEKGICLIHGDTPTTLLSMIAAKRVGIQVAHLESGLRSFNIFNPFPEELIRIVVMHCSDYLFAPSQWAYQNLVRMKIHGKCIQISGNTNIDAIRYINKFKMVLPTHMPDTNSYAIVTIHRAETLLSKHRLIKVIDAIHCISRQFQVIFPMHKPTRKYLKKYGFYNRLAQNNSITLSDLLPFPEFIHLLQRAHFIMTDGGSIQEECLYLNKPCLLMRKCTERNEGIGQNVYIAAFDMRKVEYFLANIDQFKTKECLAQTRSPSEEIATYIRKLVNK